MSKAIEVLTQMSSNASLQTENNEHALEQLLIATDLESEQAEAIINRDVTSLERQLDICPDIVCVVVPAEDDDEKDDDDNKDGDDSTEETSNHAVGF